MTERRRIAKPGPLPVILGSLALFFAVVALLAFELRTDAGSPQLAAAAPAPRRILVRRVIVTRVVEHRVDDGPSAPAPAAPAPVPAGSVPAPAPAAPAPAPLTTRSS